MKIYNIHQASVFILENCKVLNCGVGNKSKVYVEFDEHDEVFKNVMKKWQNKEYI